MKRNLKLLFVISLILTLGLGVAAFAQADTPPDAGVRGSGVVSFGPNAVNYAQFDVNVARVGTSLFGGLRWVEVSTVPTANFVRPPIIVSKQITGLRFLSANRVVIDAVGYFNDRPAAITMECLDDTAGDWVHITATNIVPPGSAIPLVIFYDRLGGVTKGNLVVFGKPLAGAFAKGTGAIQVNNTNIGQFNFGAVSVPAGVSGTIDYMDFNPLSASPMIMPAAVIHVRMVTVLTVDGNTATLQGPGTLNGSPAFVTVKVADLAKPYPVGSTTTVHDTFAITAVPLVASSWTKAYSASGPLVRGDIAVGTIQPTATP